MAIRKLTSKDFAFVFSEEERAKVRNPNHDFLSINTIRFENEFVELLNQLNAKGYKNKRIYESMIDFLNEYGFKFDKKEIIAKHTF